MAYGNRTAGRRAIKTGGPQPLRDPRARGAIPPLSSLDFGGLLGVVQRMAQQYRNNGPAAANPYMGSIPRTPLSQMIKGGPSSPTLGQLAMRHRGAVRT